MNYNPTTEEVKSAIQFALKEYDKETILEIVTHEVGGWSDEAEVLNRVNPIVLRRILYTQME